LLLLCLLLLLSGLPLLLTGISLLLPLLLALFAFGLIFLAPLFAATASALGARQIRCAQQRKRYR